MLQGSTAAEAYVMVSTTIFLLSDWYFSPQIPLIQWLFTLRPSGATFSDRETAGLGEGKNRNR
jgi:hypothetical protein